MRPRQPLEAMLIKGRNLYRPWEGRSVRRRPWADEALRCSVLGEKHARGAAARGIRDKRKVSRVLAWMDGWRLCCLVGASCYLVGFAPLSPPEWRALPNGPKASDSRIDSACIRET